MYIGSTGISGLHHLVYEVVDNAVDEAMAGHATRIDVTLLADGGCRVSDNGRGIPVDPHPENTQEVRGRDRADHAPRRREVRRRGLQDLRRPPRRRACRSSTRCRPASSSRSTATAASGRRRTRTAGTPPAASCGRPTRSGPGTIVTFWPDPAVFEETEFRAQTLIERLREMAFLNKGLEIRFNDERTDPVTEQTFKSNGGIVDFVKHLNASKEPLFKRVVSFEETGERLRGRDRDAVEHRLLRGHPLVREQHRHDRGRHARGGLQEGPHQRGEQVRPRPKGLLKEKDDNLLGEDIREGLTAIVSVKLRNPQFEGQTKTKLGNTEMRSMVEKSTNEKLGGVARGAPARGEADRQQGDRRRRGRAWRRSPPATSPGARSLLEAAAMPGKLADCSSTEPGRVRAVHRRGRLAPARRPRTRATRTSRRSCRSGARS